MVKNEMRQFWLQSFAFWEQGVSFKQKIDRMDLLPFGCKVCLLVAKCLLQTENGQNGLQKPVWSKRDGKLTVQFGLNLGDKVKNLLENLGNGGHGIALQKLKDKFGIIRESLKGSSVRCTHGSNAYALSYGPSICTWAQQFGNPTRKLMSFVCQQHGYVARFCPTVQPNSRSGGNPRWDGNSWSWNYARDLLTRKETKLPVSLKVSYSFAWTTCVKKRLLCCKHI